MLYGVGAEERHATLLTGVQPYTGKGSHKKSFFSGPATKRGEGKALVAGPLKKEKEKLFPIFFAFNGHERQRKIFF